MNSNQQNAARQQINMEELRRLRKATDDRLSESYWQYTQEVRNTNAPPCRLRRTVHSNFYAKMYDLLHPKDMQTLLTAIQESNALANSIDEIVRLMVIARNNPQPTPNAQQNPPNCN